MSKKLVPFFATHHDLVTIAHDVMAIRSIDFVRGGMDAEPRLEVLADIDDLSAFETYLIVDHGLPVSLRVVPSSAGGPMYAVDQLDNPHSIAMQTGGKHTDHHLIAGQLGTVGGSNQSEDLYALFAKVIRKRFEKIKSFYVGPEAGAMLDNGARLAPTLKSPQTYDLVR